MQFLEAYSGGLRSPLLQFEKHGHPVVFRLFPTIHVGEPAYYAAVLAHLPTATVCCMSLRKLLIWDHATMMATGRSPGVLASQASLMPWTMSASCDLGSGRHDPRPL